MFWAHVLVGSHFISEIIFSKPEIIVLKRPSGPLCVCVHVFNNYWLPVIIPYEFTHKTF